MTGALLVGCPMWANRVWVGPYYPATTRPGDELAQYAQWCHTVEGNTTFYALPTVETVRKWRDATPATFRFVFKLPKRITHDLRLRGVDAELTSFLRLLEPLDQRVGPISIQLPATFGPGDLGVLASFLRRVPRHHRWAVEVRHQDFFSHGRAHDSLDVLLADSGTERVILDSRPLFARPPSDAAERDAWTTKPRLPVVVKALTDEPVVRIIGRTSDAETVGGWQPWFAVLTDWIERGHRPFVFVHTPDNSTAIGAARQFHVRLAALGGAIGQLPELPARGEIQATLFD